MLRNTADNKDSENLSIHDNSKSVDVSYSSLRKCALKISLL